MKYILSLDQGTTSSRAIVFNKAGEIVGQAQQEFKQIYPKSGWVEHDPKDIVSSQLGVVVQALINGGVSSKDVVAMGITNQRETTIVWDKVTGEPVYNAIVWQCRRTSDYCELLKRQGYDKIIYEKTGLVLDAYFSATKIKWILDNVSGAREKAEKGELLFGTVDTYLMWNLSSRENRIHATDYTNASRTMLFNIHTLDWDEELLKLFDIPKSMLPSVHPSSYLYGYVDESQYGFKIPITGVVGDQQSALFGQLCVDEGDIKNTYGTGCFMLLNTGDKAIKSNHGLVTTLGASLNDTPPYVLEGSVFVGGAVIQWLRDEMKLIEKASDTEKIARKVDDTNGVYVVPAFVGLGAPYWESNVRGLITGVTRGTKREHIVRACLEAIAYQVYDIYKAMEQDLGKEIKSLRVDGGASSNNFLMQFQADLLNAKVARPEVIEVTALGAAYLAGLKVEYWESIEDIKSNVAIGDIFKPSISSEKREELLKGWKEAISMLLYKSK